MIRRWLRSPSRVPRPLRVGAALLLGTLWLIGIAAPASPGASAGAAPSGSAPAPGAAPSKLPVAPAPGDPTRTYPTSPRLVAEGANLYQEGCASCHGIALRGIAGTAPSLIGVGPGPMDFYLSTGRMPLEQPREEPMRNPVQYDRGQINALIAFVSRFGGPPAPSANPAKGDLALGFHEFTLNCAGCHQSLARGGLTVEAQVPALQPATAQEVAEAVRMGPFLMPRFTTEQIDQHQLDSITRYVLWTRKPSNAGGWGIYNIGPIPEGMVAWFMGLLAMVIVARLIGERLDEGMSTR